MVFIGIFLLIFALGWTNRGSGLAVSQLVQKAEAEGPHAAGKDGHAAIADAIAQVVGAEDGAQGKNPILKTAFVRFLICCIIY